MAQLIAKTDLINFIRTSVLVGNPSDSEYNADDYFISLTDEQVELYLKVVISRDYSQYTIDTLPYECAYPVTLLTKLDLYFQLATSVAMEYNLSSDDGSLYRDQKYRHCLDMMTYLRSLYNDFVDDGGTGKNTLTSYDMIIESRNGTYRNYALSTVPSTEIVADAITDTYIELSLYITSGSLSSIKIYLSNESIYDEYDPVSMEDYLIATYTDPHFYKTRITGLTELTDYVVTIAVTDLTGLTGYNELSFTTLDSEVFVI